MSRPSSTCATTYYRDAPQELQRGKRRRERRKRSRHPETVARGGCGRVERWSLREKRRRSVEAQAFKFQISSLSSSSGASLVAWGHRPEIQPSRSEKLPPPDPRASASSPSLAPFPPAKENIHGCFLVEFCHSREVGEGPLKLR